MRTCLSLSTAFAAVLTIASASFSPAIAQDYSNYPERPVTIILPYAPGGPTDNTGRPYAQYLGEYFDEEFVIENRGGAGGTIGAGIVARAKPDGYTLMITPSAVLTVKPTVVPDLSYAPLEDFIPISRVSISVGALGVHPSLPVNSVKELIAYAKEHPGELNYGSAGMGTITQMRNEVFKDLTGTDIVHVPYKGSAAALNGLLSGEVQMMIDPTTLPQHRPGGVRVLAVDSDERLEAFPDIPTIAEAGVPEYDIQNWYGFLAPAGTPQPIIDKLSAAVQEISKRPELKANFANVGLIPTSDPSPKAFAEAIKRDQEKYRKILEKADYEAN